MSPRLYHMLLRQYSVLSSFHTRLTGEGGSWWDTDIKLSSKVALMGHAICELLQAPNQCREAMRVLLHLIEKSLQRIHQGIKNSMYTTFQSIDNKVGGIHGWKDLLQAVGFRFEMAGNGLPPAVFFPQTDPGDRTYSGQRQSTGLTCKMAAKESSIDVEISVKLWRAPGCHEFLASLGLDLVEVGSNNVTLRLGKQANRRQLQFALQSLVAVFDTQEAPRSLSIDSSSSLESLSSSHSGSTSTSNFSKGSTPPLSPRAARKKSLFNPAEMEKMRIANKMQLMNQGGLSGRKVRTRGSRSSSHSDPSIHLSHQSRIRNMYGPTGMTLAHQTDMNELHEISENSESETDRQSSGKGSWGECRMAVSTNSESDASTIPECPEGDSINEQYSLSGMSIELKEREHFDSEQNRLAMSLSSSGSVEFSDNKLMTQSNEYVNINQENQHAKFHRGDKMRRSDSSNYSENEIGQFERRDTLRNSNNSNISSIDEGTCIMDSKRSSLSDSSQGAEEFIGRGNYNPGSSDLPLPGSSVLKSDLHTSGQLSSESGINSEVTSSNQSDASQQSVDLTGRSSYTAGNCPQSSSRCWKQKGNLRECSETEPGPDAASKSCNETTVQ
ncbi:hypothetical protein FSP39_017245 [Pinctada imbricata]|uniref:TTC28 C-terminal domain-containing protein n=1 Tax=Pinctada imbricata TaxID=66713 RepID=A0AA88XFS2_PINIB|nr:hypothetical protein FSP39_017245 [Pinctada imbricata]